MVAVPTCIAGLDPPARTPPTRDEVCEGLVEVERGAASQIRQRTASPGALAVSRWPGVHVKDCDTRKFLKDYIWSKAHGRSFETLFRDREGWSMRSGRRKAAQAREMIAALLAFELSSHRGECS